MLVTWNRKCLFSIKDSIVQLHSRIIFYRRTLHASERIFRQSKTKIRLIGHGNVYSLYSIMVFKCIFALYLQSKESLTTYLHKICLPLNNTDMITKCIQNILIFNGLDYYNPERLPNKMQ